MSSSCQIVVLNWQLGRCIPAWQCSHDPIWVLDVLVSCQLPDLPGHAGFDMNVGALQVWSRRQNLQLPKCIPSGHPAAEGCSGRHHRPDPDGQYHAASVQEILARHAPISAVHAETMAECDVKPQKWPSGILTILSP